MARTSQLIGCIICLFCLLSSCESADVPELDKQSTHQLDITISDFDVQYLDIDTRSTTTGSRRISFAVLNQDNEIVYSLEQVEDSIPDFGSMTCKLTSGTYTLVAVVHRSSKPADISADKVSFNNDSITDTFLASRKIVLSDDTPITKIDMKASRVVSLFRLTCNDELPENIKSFKVTMGKGSTRLNPLNGFSVGSKEHLYLIAVDPSDWQKKDFSFDIYTFLPSSEELVDVEVSAINLESEVIKTISFKNIRLGINKKTDAHGAFFVQKQAIGISYDEEWADTEVIDF